MLVLHGRRREKSQSEVLAQGKSLRQQRTRLDEFVKRQSAEEQLRKAESHKPVEDKPLPGKDADQTKQTPHKKPNSKPEPESKPEPKNPHKQRKGAQKCRLTINTKYRDILKHTLAQLRAADDSDGDSDTGSSQASKGPSVHASDGHQSEVKRRQDSVAREAPSDNQEPKHKRLKKAGAREAPGDHPKPKGLKQNKEAKALAKEEIPTAYKEERVCKPAVEEDWLNFEVDTSPFHTSKQEGSVEEVSGQEII